jgi:cell wall-associated NlpC family hydrolase
MALYLKLKARRVPYLWDGKANPLDADSSTITGLDCSGFGQYMVAKCTGGRIFLPEGSVDQHDWCEAQGLHRLAHYSDVQYATKDGARMFMCFIEPVGPRPGHVWFVCAGKTYESHGGVGVDSRAWNSLALLKNACAAYELESVA